MSLIRQISLLQLHLAVIFVVKFLFSVALVAVAFLDGWQSPTSEFVISAAVFGLVTAILEIVAATACSNTAGKAFSVTVRTKHFAASTKLFTRRNPRHRKLTPQT
jgi:protein-S-isoprenylcysteine O-methyltransferase Ste14